MSNNITARTTIDLQVDSNATNLYTQKYAFTEEGSTDISVTIPAGDTRSIIAIPDTDIQSSAKFLSIVATGTEADLALSRASLEIRDYSAAKSVTPAGQALSVATSSTVIYGGSLVDGVVMGDVSMTNPISLKGGAIGALMAKDSSGVNTNYADNNALPLTYRVSNKGTAAIQVRLLGIYDPTPAIHTGVSVDIANLDTTALASNVLADPDTSTILTAAQIAGETIVAESSVTTNNDVTGETTITTRFTGVNLTTLTPVQQGDLVAALRAKYALELGVPEGNLIISLEQGSIIVTLLIEKAFEPGTNPALPTVLVSGITTTLSNELDLAIGDTTQITPVVTPSNSTDATITYTSSNDAIATVDSAGLVTAVAAGSITITITANDAGAYTTTLAPIVVSPLLVSSISLSSDLLANPEVGNTFQVTATVLPANATLTTVTYSSSDEAVATVDSAGLVTTLSTGVVVITATASDTSGVTADLASVTVDAVSPVLVTSITVANDNAPVSEGETSQFTATVLPVNATDASVAWSINNITGSSTIDSNGLVTVTTFGEFTVTATANDASGITGTSDSVWSNFVTLPAFVITGTPTVGSLITLDTSSTVNSDGDVLTYTWTQIGVDGVTPLDPGHPTKVALGGPTNMPTFTPTVAGTYTFALMTSDGATDEVATQQSITIT